MVGYQIQKGFFGSLLMKYLAIILIALCLISALWKISAGRHAEEIFAFNGMEVKAENVIKSPRHALQLENENAPPRGTANLIDHMTYVVNGPFPRKRADEGTNVIGIKIDKATGRLYKRFLRNRTIQDDGISFQMRAQSQQDVPGSRAHYDTIYGFMYSWEKWKPGAPSGVQDFILMSDPRFDGRTVDYGYFRGAKAIYPTIGQSFRFNQGGYDIIFRVLDFKIHEIEYRGGKIPVFKQFKCDIAIYSQ